MNCPHCRAPNADDARFCGVCGRATVSTDPASSPSLGQAVDVAIIGREIAGRYRIHSKLGEGGMGAVYRAEQISLKRTVAVKLLRPEVASSPLLLRRFNAEAEAVAKLSHPNTVNIYDFGQDGDGTLFIAMEFIDGRSLRSVLVSDAPLPVRRALAIAGQVAASLTDAHAHNIVHRDLKPDNVMLQDRGRMRDVVRVLDFGIAKLRDEGRASHLQMTQAGDMLGTPQYMAPEQIRAEAIDGRTDVYALGCMLYEMVTGRMPHDAPTVMALLSKHLLEQPVAPSRRRPDLVVPPAIDQIILDAMAKDPAARPATMELFGEQLATLMATLPAETQQPPAQALIARPPPHHVHTPPAYSVVSSTPPSLPIASARALRPTPNHQTRWLVLALVLLGAGGAGVYFGVLRGAGRADGTPAAGSNVVDPWVSTDAAPALVPDAAAERKDPWASGPSAGDPSAADPPDPDPPDPDPPDLVSPETDASETGRSEVRSDGLRGACASYARMLEKLSTCAAMPKMARDSMVQAGAALRNGYSTMILTPELRKQLNTACVQGEQGIRQMLVSSGCAP